MKCVKVVQNNSPPLWAGKAPFLVLLVAILLLYATVSVRIAGDVWWRLMPFGRNDGNALHGSYAPLGAQP